MNALVFLVLTSERELQTHLEQYRRYDDEIKSIQPVPQPEQKNCKEFSLRLESQKSCESCE